LGINSILFHLRAKSLDSLSEEKTQTDKNIAAMAKNSVREASLIFGDSSLLSKRRRRGDGRETLRDIR